MTLAPLRRRGKAGHCIDEIDQVVEAGGRDRDRHAQRFAQADEDAAGGMRGATQIRFRCRFTPVSPGPTGLRQNGPYLLAALPELRTVPLVAEAVETQPDVVTPQAVPALLV